MHTPRLAFPADHFQHMRANHTPGAVWGIRNRCVLFLKIPMMIRAIYAERTEGRDLRFYKLKRIEGFSCKKMVHERFVILDQKRLHVIYLLERFESISSAGSRQKLY